MKKYISILDQTRSEEAVEYIKTNFSAQLANALSLSKVSAPMLVMKGTGINDDLNGIERPVSFPIKDMNEQKAEVVHSLAKWKRIKLKNMKLAVGKGIYTDMRALRPDEELSPIHSICVDQWDWEKHIDTRGIHMLKQTVKDIYSAITNTQKSLAIKYPELIADLPADISFVYAEDLAVKYPELTPKQRETAAAKQFGAVFIMGIGGQLSNGSVHDGRAADYDDWSTKNEDGYYGLNGDILVWNSVLGYALELSSMGIRVDAKSLERQLIISKCEDRKTLLFHDMLLKGNLPQTMGGGIGQSRLCMFLLKKKHIGEVQSSIWSEEVIRKCEQENIVLL